MLWLFLRENSESRTEDWRPIDGRTIYYTQTIMQVQGRRMTDDILPKWGLNDKFIINGVQLGILLLEAEHSKTSEDTARLIFKNKIKEEPKGLELLKVTSEFFDVSNLLLHGTEIPVMIEHFENNKRKIVVCEKGFGRRLLDELDISDTGLRKRLREKLSEDKKKDGS